MDAYKAIGGAAIGALGLASLYFAKTYSSLDVKEKALLRFVVGVAVPLFGTSGFIIYATGLYKKPVEVVGWVTLTIFAIKILSYVIEKLTRRPRNVLDYGKWAIVTGATSGIGESFAHELAARGQNVLIISRTEEKLKAVQKDILAAHPNVKVDYLAYDFSDVASSPAFYEALKRKCQAIESEGIGMLINNVGTNQDLPEYLQLVSQEKTDEVVHVNIDGTLRMTRTVLPFMTPRRKGAIINVSSGAGNHPTPLLTVYSATKAFVNTFSECLSYEMRDFNIDVLLVTPYYVVSNMFKRKNPTIMACSSHRMVIDTLSVLGHYYRAYPYYFHAIIGFLTSIYWRTPAALMKSMKKTKARAAAKAQGGATTKAA